MVYLGLAEYLKDVFITIRPEDWSYDTDVRGSFGDGERIETVENRYLGISIVSSETWYYRSDISLQFRVNNVDIKVRAFLKNRSFAKKILREVRDWHSSEKAKQRLTSGSQIVFRPEGGKHVF